MVWQQTSACSYGTGASRSDTYALTDGVTCPNSSLLLDHGDRSFNTVSCYCETELSGCRRVDRSICVLLREGFLGVPQCFFFFFFWWGWGSIVNNFAYDVSAEVFTSRPSLEHEAFVVAGRLNCCYRDEEMKRQKGRAYARALPLNRRTSLAYAERNGGDRERKEHNKRNSGERSGGKRRKV